MYLFVLICTRFVLNVFVCWLQLFVVALPCRYLSHKTGRSDWGNHQTKDQECCWNCCARCVKENEMMKTSVSAIVLVWDGDFKWSMRETIWRSLSLSLSLILRQKCLFSAFKKNLFVCFPESKSWIWSFSMFCFEDWKLYLLFRRLASCHFFWLLTFSNTLLLDSTSSDILIVVLRISYFLNSDLNAGLFSGFRIPLFPNTRKFCKLPYFLMTFAD
jgi:hypothetical protein